MLKETTIAALILALTLPLAAIADAPHKAGGTAVRLTPAHHKERCCSGRMQAQPHPAH